MQVQELRFVSKKEPNQSEIYIADLMGYQLDWCNIDPVDMEIFCKLPLCVREEEVNFHTTEIKKGTWIFKKEIKNGSAVISFYSYMFSE